MSVVTLVGLDFGTTTSSAVAATATLVRNVVTGRSELQFPGECYRSPMAFTPMNGPRIDVIKIQTMIDDWLAAVPGPLFGGGALLTGLTAQAANAETLVNLIRSRIGDAVVARADDPRLESWLAFMGSCASLSRKHPDRTFIHLDIGGGTTNVAIGRNGEVLATGSYFIGARHVQVEPGTYRIVRLSNYARVLFKHLDISKGEDDELTSDEVSRITTCYRNWLAAIVNGDGTVFEEPTANYHLQAPLHRLNLSTRPVVTLSGGVGALVYSGTLPGITHYGDLGVDLAVRLLESPWSDDFRQFIPDGGGRATAFGLLRHSTQISGSTIFLSDPSLLPLRDLPILGVIEYPARSNWKTILELLRSSLRGGAIQIAMSDHSADAVRTLGNALAGQLADVTGPVVILVPGNIGKTLGAYITRWGVQPLKLAVIDEVPATDARFVHLGALRDGIVPVSFYGLQR